MVRSAAAQFQRAVDIDPEFARGHWGLLKLCTFQVQAKVVTAEEGLVQCLPPLLKALEIAPFLAEAHISHAHYLGIVGEPAGNSGHSEMAVRLDPLNPFVIGMHAVQLVMLGEYHRAIEAPEKASSMAPGHGFGFSALYWAHDALGHEEVTIQALAKMMRYWRNEQNADLLEAAHALGGFRAAVLQHASRLAATPGSGHEIRTAELHELAGDHESGIDWVETAGKNKNPEAPYTGAMVKSPGMHTHPRFQALLVRMGLVFCAELR